MLDPHGLLLALALALGIFLLQLHLDNALEFVALELGLFAQAPLLLRLLLLPSRGELLVDGLLALPLRALLLTRGPLRGLHGTLRPQRVHLGSFVLRLLLHGPELGCLLLFLLGDALLLLLQLAFPHLLRLLIVQDLLLLEFLRQHLLLLDFHGSRVCTVHLDHQALRSHLLLLLLLYLLGLQGLDLLEDEGALLVPGLLLPHPLGLPVLDLLDDDLGAAALALEALLLAHLVHLQRLEALDLHHGVELALLLLLLVLHVPLLLDLRVADRDDLGVEHHLVHVLHVVHVLVQHLLGPL
mmetsp:Transcript_106884/g.344911  ORF Transcript_106884/g.344911 Transcript_106884/m.344911 type:complete len:298 (+) Transcript_106884:504-1397(+)